MREPTQPRATTGSTAGTGQVRLTVLRVAPAQLPQVAARLVLDRGRLRRTPGVRFAKILGTGTGQTFTPSDADLQHWALLTVSDHAPTDDGLDDSPVVRGWTALAHERLDLWLSPLSGRGQWSGQEPFGPLSHAAPAPTGPVLVITRARLRARRAVTFWRATPPVSRELADAGGLLLSLGIGEAPLGLQGTVSLWSDAAAVARFAYRAGSAHRQVVQRTPTERWYAEELFARLAVLRSRGTYRGQHPLGQPTAISTAQQERDERTPRLLP